LKTKTKKNRKKNREIRIVTISFVLLFLGLSGYITYYSVTHKQELINNSYNGRQQMLIAQNRRGRILSAKGEVLAQTVEDEEGNEKRQYPYQNLFSHAVGYAINGRMGVEAQANYYLINSSAPLSQKAGLELAGEKYPGDDVYTTLDVELQQVASTALGVYQGAILVTEPDTGKILAMVSKPDFNPEEIGEMWEELIADEDSSILLNRVTQGLYPPGSTFKVLTAMEYLIENPDSYSKFRYECKGTDSFSGNVINCYGREQHGSLNLKMALAKSCNGAFAKIGTTLDVAQFRKLTERFMFNKSLPVDFEYNKSKFSLSKDSDMGELTQTVMGQGKTMITPLENAVIAATVANNGEMMVPYVVDHVESDAGKRVTSYEPKSKGQIIDKWVAEKMNKLMRSVVTSGTGYSLSSLPYEVAGKTGSAEYDSEGNSHAWFVGFAPADKPKIAVSIIVEGAGTGSRYAVPIAKEMFGEYLGW